MLSRCECPLWVVTGHVCFRPKADIWLWKPSRILRIFSSDEYFLRVLQETPLTTDSLDTFLFIITPYFKESLTESIS